MEDLTGYCDNELSLRILNDEATYKAVVDEAAFRLREEKSEYIADCICLLDQYFHYTDEQFNEAEPDLIDIFDEFSIPDMETICNSRMNGQIRQAQEQFNRLAEHLGERETCFLLAIRAEEYLGQDGLNRSMAQIMGITQ